MKTLYTKTKTWTLGLALCCLSAVGSINAQAAPGGAPANDLCANPIAVTCGSTTAGTTVGATNDDDQIDCGPAITSPGVWYSIVGDGSDMTAGICGTVVSWDSKISVYTGTCGALVCVDGNDDFCGGMSEVSWSSLTGTTYYILVHGFGGETGAFDLAVTCAAPANDLCGDAFSLSCGDVVVGSTDQSTNTDAPSCRSTAGVWFTFTGDGNDVYLDLSGSDFDTYMGVTEACGGTCVESDDDGGDGLTSALQMSTVNGTVYDVYVSGFSSTGNYQLEFTCLTPPANDQCADAISVACGDVVSGNTDFASADGSLALCGTSLTAGPGVWYAYTGTGEDVTVSTCSANTTFDTKLGVFSGDCTTPICVAGDDDDGACSSSGLQSTVEFYGEPGVAYYFYVTGFSSATGDFDLSVSCVCTAEAGTLTADATPVCTSGGSATISATEGTAPVAPSGFAVTYVLTSNPGLIIEAVNSTPDFTVGPGEYTIHTLVSSATLDLSGVVFGTTAAADVLATVTTNNICAALDVTGAPITVNEEVSATISGDVVSCGGGEVALQIDFTGAGPWDMTYEIPGGVQIQDLGVTDNPYSLVFGIPIDGSYTLVDVSNTECGAGTVSGTATVTIEAPDAGTITADEDIACFAAPFITISATPDANAVVPAGYSTVYLLVDASGNVVDDAASASFVVTALGNYTIHTLVYDASTLTPGSYATVADLLAVLSQGTGSICASLDLDGAAVWVADCTPPVNDECAGAIDLTVGATCLSTAGSTAFATLSTQADVCGGTQNDDVWYSFTATETTATVEVQGSASFDAAVELLGGVDCGTLVSFGCVDDGLTGDPEVANLTGLTIGDVYYVRVSHWFSTLAADPTFDICVYDTPPPPAEDEPCGATALSMGANGPYDHFGYTAAAWEVDAIPTADCDAQGGFCFNPTVENSQWFSFVAPASGNMTVSASGSDFDTQVAVFSGTSCQDVESGTGVLVGANDDDPAGGLQSLVILCGLTPGDTYFVMLDGFGGAEGTATLTLTETTLDAAFTYVAAGLTVDFTDASTASGTITDWAWDFDDAGATSTDEDPSHTFTADGPYDVCLTVTDENGCTSEYCEGIQVTDIPTTIAEAVEQGMEVYPNPSNGQFVVEISGVEADVQIVVMDVTGRQVYTEGATLNNSFRKDLNLNVASGTYFIQIATLEGVVTRKIQIH